MLQKIGNFYKHSYLDKDCVVVEFYSEKSEFPVQVRKVYFADYHYNIDDVMSAVKNLDFRWCDYGV